MAKNSKNERQRLSPYDISNAYLKIGTHLERNVVLTSEEYNELVKSFAKFHRNRTRVSVKTSMDTVTQLLQPKTVRRRRSAANPLGETFFLIKGLFLYSMIIQILSFP